MKQLIITEIFQQAWKQTKAHIWILAGLYVAFTILSSLFALLVDPLTHSWWGSSLVNLISAYLFSLFSLGYLRNVIEAQADIEPQMSAYRQPVMRVINYVLASVIYAIAVGLGTILFILPGIYVAVRLQYYTMFILEEEANPIQALRHSWELTREQTWSLLLVNLSMIGLALIGLLLLFVGLFVAIPVIYGMYVIIYRNLSTSPSSGM